MLFYSCLIFRRFYRVQPYSCNHSNCLFSACRSFFGFRMDVSLTGLLTTVAVASLVEIIYHVKLVRKIGANISFETFWKNCDQLFRKNAVLLAILLCDLLIFKGGDFMAFILWQVTFVVLVSIIIMASNNAPDA